MNRHAFLACFLACAPHDIEVRSPVSRGDPTSALTVAAEQDDEAYAIVKSLVDEVGPRLSGSEGDARAVAWAKRTLTERGLSVTTDPVSVPHWERGTAKGVLTKPYGAGPIADLEIVALGSSVATPDEGVTAALVCTTSLEALEKLEDTAVRDRIVFIDMAMERQKDGSGYGKTVPIRVNGAIAAAKKHARAVVIRSVATDPKDPHTGIVRYDPGVNPIPAGALSGKSADVVAKACLESTDVPWMKLTLTTRSFPNAMSANVIGDVKGSERPDEIVLLGAHLDSWDTGRGAVDDGAGIGIIVRAATLIAPSHPRRTIRVVLFASEENSGAGGRAYASLHAKEKHVASLEADSGCGAPYDTRWLGDPSKKPVFDSLVRALAPFGIVASDKGGEGGADLGPLRTAGVPVVDIRQDASLYFDVHHSPGDTMDAVDKLTLRKATAAFAMAAWSLSESDDTLGAIPEGKRARKW